MAVINFYSKVSKMFIIKVPLKCIIKINAVQKVQHMYNNI